MNDLLENAKEFIESGEDNIKKERYNVSVADFFKAIAVLCDYLIYKNIKTLPKNHLDRFNLLKAYFPEIYSVVSPMFRRYTESYNQRMTKQDAIKFENYAHELRNFVSSKEKV